MFWCLLVIALGFCGWKFYNTYTYWKKKGVLQAPYVDIFLNNWHNFSGVHSVADLVIKDYNQYQNERYGGAYQFFTPALTLRDPELIKHITVKDFDHFVDHIPALTETSDPLWSKNLLFLSGEKWREMRATLTPTFTSSKMRSMFILISECAKKLTEYYVGVNKQIVEIEAKDISTRYANDVIASAGFGVSCDSLTHKDNEFYKMGKLATDFSGFWNTLKFTLLLISADLFKALGLRLSSTRVYKFFTNLVQETVRFREKEGITRPDMIHLLMEARKGRLDYGDQNDHQSEGFATVQESHIGKTQSGKKGQITDVDMTAQVFIFFVAGYETVSTAMSFMAYELATNPQIQQKLHGEIEETLKKFGGNLTYETLTKMKYLDMVVSETLRKWPPTVVGNRICVKDYKIEPVNPGEKPLPIEKGTVITIPQFAIHRDEKYFPEPSRFDPERFSEENKASINPFAYIPFGAGPRNCIGSRFALLEIKALFVHILSQFELVATEKTPIPMRLSTRGFNLSAKDGFWIGLKKKKHSTILMM